MPKKITKAKQKANMATTKKNSADSKEYIEKGLIVLDQKLNILIDLLQKIYDMAETRQTGGRLQ